MKEENNTSMTVYNKTNKTVSIVLLLLIIFMQVITLPINVQGYEAGVDGIKLTSTSDSLSVGDKVEVIVSTTGQGVSAVDAAINYDTDIFEKIKKEDITTLCESEWIVIPDEFEGKEYLGITTADGKYRTGNLFKITLTVKKAASETSISFTETKVAFADKTTAGEKGNPYLEESMDLSVNIKTPSEYTITYNPNTEDAVTDMPTPATEKKLEGTEHTIATEPKRAGYRFTGWKLNETETVYQPGNKVTINSNLDLYAQWQKTSKLTVNPNEGTWEESKDIKEFTQDENTTKEIPNPTITPNGNRIQYNANGGQTVATQAQQLQTTRFNRWTGATLNGTTYTFGANDVTLIATYTGNDITLPEATKPGSRFIGWSTDLEGTNIIGRNGETYAPEYTTPNAPITLFAQYQDETYTLTIDANGGRYIGSTSVQGKMGDTVTINNPTKQGVTITLDNNDGTATRTITQECTFDGWTYSAGSLNGTTYTFGASNATLEANYTPNAVALPQNQKVGYHFDGWYTSAEGGSQIVEPYTPRVDETIYAHWTPNQYTVTFNPGQDGTVNPTTKRVTYDEKYGELPVPTKIGHTFNVWVDSNGNPVTKDDVVKITQDIELTATWDGETYTLTIDPNGGMYSGNTTVQGTYGSTITVPNPTAPSGYTITLNKNDGTETTQVTQTMSFNGWTLATGKGNIDGNNYTFRDGDGTIVAQYTPNNVQLEIPTRTGYTFDGWYKEETGGTKVDMSSYVPESDETLYAHWEETVYNITYQNLKGSDNSQNPTTYTIMSENIVLVDLPDQGKSIFKGWYTTDDSTGTKVTSIDTSKLGNITLYARWEENGLYLKSQKYKVGENDIDNYEDGDIYLDKIEPETTVAEFIKNCETNGTISIINEDGDILEEDDLVGTTMTIKVTRYDEEITMTAVVMGDIDGDGKATAQDLSELNKAYLGTSEKELTGARFKAADIDDSGKITATDLSELNRASLGTSKLTYNKHKNTSINTTMLQYEQIS